MTVSNFSKIHAAQRLRSQLLTGEIIRAIECGCIDSTEIAEEISFSSSAVRKHLSCLTEAGRVIRTVEALPSRGKRLIYSLPAGHVSVPMSLPSLSTPLPAAPAVRDPLVAALFGPAPAELGGR